MRLLSGRKWSPGSLQANISSVVVDRERGISTFRESLWARSTWKSRSPPAKSNATSSIGWSCGLSAAAIRGAWASRWLARPECCTASNTPHTAAGKFGFLKET
eukprot:scaffold132743_cov63-Phaeocystis_antarctica.AAC.3